MTLASVKRATCSSAKLDVLRILRMRGSALYMEDRKAERATLEVVRIPSLPKEIGSITCIQELSSSCKFRICTMVSFIVRSTDEVMAGNFQKGQQRRRYMNLGVKRQYGRISKISVCGCRSKRSLEVCANNVNLEFTTGVMASSKIEAPSRARDVFC